MGTERDLRGGGEPAGDPTGELSREPDGGLDGEPAADLLVLWDIDQTLIEGGGVSRTAYAAAFTRVIGHEPRAVAGMAGRTERAIATETLLLNGVPADPGTIARLNAALDEELHARADLLAAAGRVLPGAAETVLALAGHAHVHQSALTGNMRSLARLKLTVFGLAEHIDLTSGAFGDDAHDRADLLPFAWRRARTRLGRGYDAASTVLIGDTVHDIAAATAHGARAVGVATGATSAAALLAAGAAAALPDLTDTPAAVHTILG
ncbi:HAD family hydrolase [Streptomyces iconiensis]|uniref:Haloacid dehalogenase-like hydrolase n=1 Tax=Streptomyces iconiensis TaxID=1384038 RepID=A0ABT7A6Y5_9ACTN|nr:haloacid dehalogenase-like hydrolase [Streptomyces iconiensis]MDJ1136779.1 haloacid dehalogenase-like hydrolase [Streptomyces iconiensis]